MKIMRHIVIVCVALLCLSAASATAAATGKGEDVTYTVDKQTYQGYFVAPSPQHLSGAPLVLLIHDWDGLTDYEVRRADMLAEMGYAVFAADLFGAGVRPTKLEDKRQHTGELYADRRKMRRLLSGALDAAKTKGADVGNAAAAGYCFGGAAVLELARMGAPLKGFVTFHGGLATPEGQDYRDVKGKLLILHGAADQIISMAEFAALADELEKAGVANEMISYGGAPHSFTLFGTEKYREDADRKSWQRFAEFLDEVL